MNVDKEIIELIKGLASGAETILIWYLVLDFAKSVVFAVSSCGVFYLLGLGFGRGWKWLAGDFQ